MIRYLLVLGVGASACRATESDDTVVETGDASASSESETSSTDAATGSSSGDPSSGSTSSASNATETMDLEGSSSTGGPSPGASFGSGSAFDDVMQMFEYLNEQREGYLPHSRWRGLPWTGSQHEMVTWPVVFSWDDALAAEAQLEADSLAAGTNPEGSPATDGLTPPLYVRGVDTAHYVVLGPEHPDSWGMSNQSSLGREHGSARMALYYHDPGGAGPVLERVGIGASDAGDGSTWWVLVFE